MDDEILISHSFNESEFKNFTEVQNEYRRKKLKESLLGPFISTLIHIAFIMIASLFKGEFKKISAQVEVHKSTEQIIEEPPPPPPPPQEIIEPELLTTSETLVPDLKNTPVDPDVLSEVEEIHDEAPEAEIFDDMEMVSDVKPSISPLQSAKMFSSRSAKAKSAALSKYGGSQLAQQSLIKALNWLAKNQNPDGSWGHGPTEAMTALAVLTFLAHGETPKSQKYGSHVSRGIAKLAQWGNENKFPIGGGRNSVYSHALVAYALSEAYAMTGTYGLLKPMNNTISYICSRQNINGGFFYAYVNEGETNFSNASWNWQALKAAKVAGCTVPELDFTINKSVKHILDSATDTGFIIAVIVEECEIRQCVRLAFFVFIYLVRAIVQLQKNWGSDSNK